MGATLYEPSKGKFSEQAHLLARALIYPSIFGVDASRIEYDGDTLVGASARGDQLDGEMGIDRVIRVSPSWSRQGIPITVQERFRDHRFFSYRDITITEWNHASSTPSELYKLQANLFVYGYVRTQDGCPISFSEVWAIDVLLLLSALASERIRIPKLEKNNKQQTFVTVPFGEIETQIPHAIVFHENNLTAPDTIVKTIVSKYSPAIVAEIATGLSAYGDAKNGGIS